MSVYLETGDIMPILACEPVRMWSSFTRCCINLKAAGYLLPSSARNLLLSTNNLLIAREKALSLFSTTVSRIAQMLRSLLPFLEVTHNFTQNNNTPHRPIYIILKNLSSLQESLSKNVMFPA